LYGNLDELVQAGGGNISVKNYDTKEMIIKSSGVCLTDVTDKYGYSIIDMNTMAITNNTIPSLETPFHVFLKKYTVHLHPTLVNLFVCTKNTIELKNKFIDVEYVNVGSELCDIIKKLYNGENIVLLRNHGIIFTSDNMDELKLLIHETYEEFKSVCDTKYNYVNLLNYEKLLKQHTPYKLFKFSCISGENNFRHNLQCYTPDIVIYMNDVFVYGEDATYVKAQNKYKYYQITEVIRSYDMLYSKADFCVDMCVLSNIDVNLLLNRDDEKYRKSV